jgi:Tol biopolymer transport system component
MKICAMAPLMALTNLTGICAQQENAGALSPAVDTNQIVYVVNSTTPEIGVIDSYSSNTHIIDLPGLGSAAIQTPTMAPDGSTIAFTTEGSA